MPSIGSTTRTIRFSPEDLGIIEDLMKKEDTTFNKAVHLLISGGVHPKNTVKVVPTEEKIENKGTPIPKTSYEAISEMANLMRVPTEKLLDDVKELLEDGTLYYSGNRLINPRYEDFERVCETKKQDPDKVIMNVIRQMGG